MAGVDVVVGRPALLAERGLAMPPELEAARSAAESRGQTAIAAGWDGQARAVFAVADTVKPTSAEAVAELKELGLRAGAAHAATTRRPRARWPRRSGSTR